MSSSSNLCDFDNIITEPTGAIYRFFNQPIEQIPKWTFDKFQILVHVPTGGLHWLTVDQCQQVVTCLSIDENHVIQAELKDIAVLKVFEAPDPTGCNVDISECCSSSSSESSSGFASSSSS